MEPEIAFGLVLRELRKAKSLSQEFVAFEAGLQRNFISLLELGQRSPSIKTIFKLARVLGVTPSKMMALTEAKVAKAHGR